MEIKSVKEYELDTLVIDLEKFQSAGSIYVSSSTLWT